MKMKDTDLLMIYNDYSYKVYLPELRRGDFDVTLPAREGNDIEEVEVTWEQVKFWAKRLPKMFRERVIRFSVENDTSEEEILKELRITNLEKTRNEIWKQILDSTDGFIEFVVECNDIVKLKKYYGEMVYLTNTNSYPIPEKNKLYLKARIEELDSGVINTDLRPSPMNDVLNIFAEEDKIEVAEVVEEEIVEEPKEKVKKTTPKKTTTRTRKTTTKK